MAFNTKEWGPGETPAVFDMVREVVPTGVTGFAPKLAIAPAGNPLTERLTGLE